MSEKIAVVLFNLGGPDSREAIRPFLMNFFMDKNIIRLPLIFRFLLAWLISRRRSRKEAGVSYGELGGKSPLLENTQAQASALEDRLNLSGQTFKVFVSMRYWHPMAKETLRAVGDWEADKIILLPLYPQFSTTTTKSSLGVWAREIRKSGFKKPTSMICCYPDNEGFIRASAENIRAQYDRAVKDGHAAPRLLLSAHGLPESVITDGDPYQWQCEYTAAAIIQKLGIEDLDWIVCYQSRVGPMKWIGPSTEDEIRRAATEGKAVVIYPHAFTQEHVETLVELDIEYKHLAQEIGIPGYYRAQTAGTHPDFIEGLAGMVRDHLEQGGISAEKTKRLCPGQFKRCCQEDGRMDF
ncbi:MAG: ferrochelatase [Alphaproteobacteria bacterium]|nr:ferrochelatase [Alphaproteobacteria bacterium]